MNVVPTNVFNPISKAAREIRSNWSTKERSLRRQLAQYRTRQILALIEKSTVSAN